MTANGPPGGGHGTTPRFRLAWAGGAVAVGAALLTGGCARGAPASANGAHYSKGHGPSAPKALGPSPGKGHPGRPAAGRPLRVVASAYPLAQLVSYIGGSDVDVDDLAPPAVQPQGLSLGPAGRASVASAGLVVDVGDGYQPDVEAAARAGGHELSVLPAISGKARPYEFWLDPKLMSLAALHISAALSSADPGGAHQFHDGYLDFESLATSIESDYISTLGSCPGREIVTADGAFGRMAADFGLTDVAASTTGLMKTVALVSQAGLPAVFSEVGVPSSLVLQVSKAAKVKLATLDPMEVAPVAGVPPKTYFAVMEANLMALEGPLDCDTSSGFP